MSTDSVHHSVPPSYASPPITIVLTVILLVFFFVGFFSIYFCRCFMESLANTWNLRGSPSGTPVGQAAALPGLDPLIIESFPTFPYSSVKDFRREKYGLECAICLCEFQDNNILRLLTACCHVFHQDCIDLWLESHKTCPVCRRSLDSLHKPSEKSPAVNDAMREVDEDGASMEDAFSIDIKEDIEEARRNGEEGAAPSSAREFEGNKNQVERFPRSHSTGHSIARTRGEEDRFTLRLPQHVREKISRGHNWTGSCTTFGEFSSKTAAGNGGFGEVLGFSGGDINNV